MDEILKEKLITNVEALEILGKRAKEIELGYEQKNTLDQLKKHCTLSKAKSIELMEKLSEIKKINERQVIAITNMLPKDKDDLRVLLEKDYRNLSEEDKKLILETVSKYIK